MRNNIGFTLIELMVVMILIGILAALSIVLLDPAGLIRKGNESAMRTNLTQVTSAVVVCIAARREVDSSNCNSVSALSIKNPNGPTNAVYDIHDDPALRNSEDGYVQIAAQLNNCTMLAKVMNNLGLWNYLGNNYKSGEIYVGPDCMINK